MRPTGPLALTRKSSETLRLRGFSFPLLSLRFQDGFRWWNADRILELLVGEVVFAKQVDVSPRDDGMVGDGSPDLRSELVGGCLAAMLKDTVNTRLSGMLSITSESGGRPSIDIFRRVVFGNLEIMPCRFTYLCVKEPYS